jgi:vancomycin aglycone glucosyltransferase
MSKILISSIGTRGEVQPIVALALELKALGHDATLCAAPDFKSWIESFGIKHVPVGPPLKGFSMRAPSGKRIKFSKAQAKQMVEGSVRNQFQVMGEAAKGADLVVVAGALQTAGRSIAELLKIPYVYAAYCAGTLPSWNHPPPRMRMRFPRSQSLPRFVNGLLWTLTERMWNSLFRNVVNEQRKIVGLAPIDNMTPYVFTDHPWLAADATLGPAAPTSNMQIFQTGAWMLRDSSSLPDELEKFLNQGKPPIYFGFGSMVSPGLTVPMLLDAARKLGRRAIISKGWANLELPDAGDDCISIGEVSHEKLFPRVAAIVHHGGAGTTTTAARAGTPQVIVPHLYDQFYWAHRVEQLGIGTSIQEASQSAPDELVEALRISLSSATTSSARALASRIDLNGANIAARKLVQEFL